MKSANGDSCVQELSDMKESIFSTDVCMDKLENQLRIVVYYTILNWFSRYDSCGTTRS